VDNLIGVTLDGVVVLLLSAAIVYGIILHRKLTALQSAQSDLAKLLGRLDAAISQASSTVSALKSNAAMIETSTRPVGTHPLGTHPLGTHPVGMRRVGAADADEQTADTPALASAAAAVARRRKAPASLVGGNRIEAARELLAAMQAVRSA